MKIKTKLLINSLSGIIIPIVVLLIFIAFNKEYKQELNEFKNVNALKHDVYTYNQLFFKNYKFQSLRERNQIRSELDTIKLTLESLNFDEADEIKRKITIKNNVDQLHKIISEQFIVKDASFKNNPIQNISMLGKISILNLKVMDDIDWYSQKTYRDLLSIVKLRAQTIGFFVIFIFLFLMIINYRMLKEITKSFRNLLDGIHCLQKGDYSFRMSIKSNDELMVLSKEFTELAQKLFNANEQINKESRELLAAEQLAVNSQRTLKMFAENTSDILWTFDKDFKLLYVSPSVKTVFNYTSEEILEGKSVDFNSMLDSLKSLYSFNLEIVPQTRTIEFKLNLLPQRTVWLEMTIDLILEGVVFCGATCTARDISARKELEAVQELTLKILKIVNTDKLSKVIFEDIGFILKDYCQIERFGIRLRMNNDFPFFSHFGISDSFLETESSLIEYDYNGQIITDENKNMQLGCICGLIIQGKAEKLNQYLTEYGSFWTTDLEQLQPFFKKNPGLFNYRGKCYEYGNRSLALIPVKTGGSVVGLIQLQDTLPGKFTKKLVQNLEDIAVILGITINRIEIGEYFRQAKEEAERANKIKTNFLSNMSHEIRNPLNGIMNLISVLEQSDLTQEHKNLIEMMRKSSGHLFQIVNDILDFSKIEAGKKEVRVTEFSLSKLIKEVIDYTKVLLTHKNIKVKSVLDPELPVIIRTDETILKQILLNILNNSVKFTETGIIKVEVRIIEKDNTDMKLCFILSDTGIGIPKDKLDSIFEIFSQVDTSYNKQYQGTGLGLSIVKELVKLLRGEVSIQSVIDAGSIFTLEIPVTAVIPKVERDLISNPQAIKNFAQVRLLLAEDNVINAVSLTAILKSKGFFVDTVSNGFQVLQKIEDNKYDIILMDVQMPKLDGIECTRIIREKESGTNNHYPIIALTGYAFAEDKAACEEAGMDDFISKPINEYELIEKIYLHLNGR